ALVCPRAFGGAGSYGNGAAMRVAPLGDYFAGDPAAAARHAELSAEVTHTHTEGIAGAVAVAVAAAHAARLREADPLPSPAAFLELVLPLVPESEVKTGIRHASEIEP